MSYKSNIKKINIVHSQINNNAVKFCKKFINGNSPRYVFGCNSYGKSIADKIKIKGFIDDEIKENYYYGKKVFKSNEVEKAALVVSAVVLGRPLTALSKLKKHSLSVLDYFAFQKYSGLDLKNVVCLDEFNNDFYNNLNHYKWIFDNLADAESKVILNKIINFRISKDLFFMKNFIDSQYRQYFEPFLKLQETGETFIDVGCYDGFTSIEFIKRFPNYKSIHIFEPEPNNMKIVKKNLSKFKNISYHPYGASDKNQSLKFKSAGSASIISDHGDISIKVKKIDDLIKNSCSFIKMDIEGGEIAAINGASKTICRFSPRLAISVYHKVNDLWKIPQEILKINSNYKIYLRHYTEGFTETVMFFVPKNF
jgi:FkbM family methyltransferase